MKKQQEAIKELLLKHSKNIKSRDDLAAVKRQLSKKYRINILLNVEVLEWYRKLVKSKQLTPNLNFEELIKKRAVRTMSGIAPVAVLTKPFSCPGECAYCPQEDDVPQSYLSNEPAVMRAIRCNYEPYKQVKMRIQALEANGHLPTKIELIVIGGTWSYFPPKYKYWYILNCFKAANDYNKKNTRKISFSQSLNSLKKQLKHEQKRNEKAKYKIIGLTLETRPDFINFKELNEMRDLGCTRVEIGVQAIDDKILETNKRGHGVKETIEATKKLRDYGFKITYHFMPGLPGSTAKKDVSMFKQMFEDENFQPDQIKFYPTVVTKGSLLYKWWQQGKYKPYSDKVLKNIIINCKKYVPKYVRIIRLIRDIPGESIEAGNKITNLRQVIKNEGVVCNCIRCREVKEKIIKKPKLEVIKYRAGNNNEYFISYTSPDGACLYGFCRLRINKNKVETEKKFLNNTGLIRELHVYGMLVSMGSKKKVQHAGLGKKLMQEAEKIAETEKVNKMAVISGVGVREYYRKLGYRLKDTYMIKYLNIN